VTHAGARTKLGAACALAVLTALGLTGCQNPGRAAARALTHPPTSTHHRAGPTKRTALAFVRKTFTLYDQGQYQRACATSESKPYLAVDRHCAGSARKTVERLHQLGVGTVPTGIRMDLHGATGTVTFTWLVNGQRLSSLEYLHFAGHRWWATGDNTTGDRGL
jgi:hypothetical protein